MKFFVRLSINVRYYYFLLNMLVNLQIKTIKYEYNNEN